MATIGLDKPYYSIITEGSGGVETYAAPVSMGKAISAEITLEFSEGDLYGDDGLAEAVREFKKGKLTFEQTDLAASVRHALLGAKIDNNGAVVSSAEDEAPYVAIGFRARRSDGKYKYFWLYKVRFSVPGTSLQTKGDNINFSTPKLEGEIMRRNKTSDGSHPWKVDVTEGDTGVESSTLSGWFSNVYEPDFTTSSSTT